MISAYRSMPPPSSLANQKSYSADDVRDQLHFDFMGKCYLCESLIARGTFEVEHRRPKSDGGEEFDWNNLFPACRTCNGGRRRKYPVGGLLNPGEHHDIESKVHQWMSTIAGEELPEFEAAASADVQAVNTAKELRELHREKEERSADLCSAIRRHLVEVRKKALEMYAAYGSNPTGEAYLKSRAEVRRLVSKKSPYTALVRSCVRDFPLVSALFD
jgi:5-methylcytosine-specific restriction endonuclease McrA